MTRGGASGGGEASRGAAHGVRRGGRGRGGGGGPVSREVLLSKKLSWLLRHGAEKEGLKLGHGGFVNLQEVVCDAFFVNLLCGEMVKHVLKGFVRKGV